MDEEKTGRANSFLRMIRRSRRGGLKIYLGYCAGVGKTYRMLEEGHSMVEEGIDIVAGFVETHGRADTAKLLEGLEIIPRISMEYKGIRIEEMDVDAILKRKPSVVLVDELAHTNVPGCRNMKRYEDVMEILAAGIHVITTLNVQHLESLYDTVEKFVHIKVRERLPDTILSEADQIVNIDLSTEDLRKRLEEGKVYSMERVSTAMENFFISSNLEKLRELTLRELASQIDFRRREPIPEEVAAMPDQVMVCLSSRGPNSERLLRYASRFAGRLNKNWYALYVQAHAEDPLLIDTQTQAALSETLTLAKQLGAIVFTYKGEDLAETILRFASEYRIGHIIIGKPSKLSLYERLTYKKNLAEKLTHHARGINLVIVDTAHTFSNREENSSTLDFVQSQQPIRLGQILKESTILIRRDTAFKEEILRDLTRSVFSGAPEWEEFYNALLLREKESSTFFNEGVAFPHLRIEREITPRVALGIIQGGIVDIATSKPVKLVFLIITSVKQQRMQAQLLAAASKMVSNHYIVDVLLSTQSSRKVLDEIIEWEA